MTEYASFKDYFYSRRGWFFSLMMLLFVADFVDTLLKGGAYLHTLGPVYDVRMGSYIALSAVAMKVRNEAFHVSFAIFALVFEVILILKFYLIVA
jgi:hypothetical protein